MDEKNHLVIAFHPDGTVQHTLLDKFLAPDFGVEREVVRMTDIRHEKAINCFYIVGLLDPVKGRFFDRALLDELHIGIMSDIPHKCDRRGVLLFGAYDDAVRCEIRVIDALRIRGERVGGNAEYTSEIDLSPAEYTGTE